MSRTSEVEDFTHVDTVTDELGACRRSQLVVSNLESACDAARAGIGITVAFSYHIAESIQSGELIALLQEFQPPPQPVNFLYSPNRFMPVKLRAFLDFTLPRLRARLAEVQKGVASRAKAS